MGRRTFLAAVAAIGALALAGCGTAATQQNADELALTAAAPPAGSAAAEVTDGRLGDATTIHPDAPLRELSPGGPLDLSPRGDGPRRDGVGAGATCANPDQAPAVEALGAIAATTLCLLNGERADRGLAPLALNAKLTAAATAYAHDLVAGSYFSHTGRDGSNLLTRIRRTGYIREGAGWALGENLAWGTGSLSTPGSIMQAWMNSPGHRENILNPDYREIGIGIVAGNPAQADGAGATYDTEFGLIEADAPAQGASGSTKSRAAARKAARRRAQRRAKARKARSTRNSAHAAGKSLGKARRRGPKAHISV